MRRGDRSRGGVGGQGNGGKRLTKVEKMVAALADKRINGEGACGWEDGCVWNGVLIDGLCAEHRSEKLREARVRRWQEGRSKPTPPPEYGADHTAPWHCRVQGCEKCDGKMGYEEWAGSRT